MLIIKTVNISEKSDLFFKTNADNHKIMYVYIFLSKNLCYI